MEYQQCHRHVKPQWKQQQENWLEGRLPCSCIKGTNMRVKRAPRYYQHHAALTLTLTTITVLLSLHLVLLGDAVSASADVDPQETDKVLLPTLDGKSSYPYLERTENCKCRRVVGHQSHVPINLMKSIILHSWSGNIFSPGKICA